MAEKFIDLAGTIIEDLHLTESEASGVGAAMSWLHMHPDQVPGRTLTRSDMVEAFGDEYAGWATHCLARVGYTVVPDPEPTNAEKWEKFIRGTHFNVSGWTGFDATEQFAKILDEQGVKATGGDDE